MGVMVIWRGTMKRRFGGGWLAVWFGEWVGGGMGTYKYGCTFAMATCLGLDSREEGGSTVGKPGFWQWSALNGIWTAVESCILDEDEDGNGSSTHGSDSPPEHLVPRPILGDKPTEGTAAHDGEND